MDKEVVDIADLDVVYLTYDEPQKEAFWAEISNKLPWAVRVDGVKGSDAAHKAAADASTTDRFILIDGDNMPDWNFWNQQLLLDDRNRDCVFRWKCVNDINGLSYGNGGLSSWTRDFIYNMRTHEASDGSDDTAVEFCYDEKYWAMHDVWGMTYPNKSPYQAWRAGFREGVKMCLDRGSRPTLEAFESMVHKRNLEHLQIWHNVGMDAENGLHAMLGARYGTYLTILTDWDYTEVQDFDQLAVIYDNAGEFKDTEAGFIELGERLEARLGLPNVYYEEAESEFFKQIYTNQHRNRGIMVSEMDVIRAVEGW